MITEQSVLLLLIVFSFYLTVETDDRLRTGIKDFFLGGTPDHALIVAGIDLTDPNNSYVILKDPGTGDVAKPYPLDQFMDAWNDANCFMVSTNEPTPAFELQHMNLHDINGMSVESFLSANDVHNQKLDIVDVETLEEWRESSDIEHNTRNDDDNGYDSDDADDKNDNHGDEDYNHFSGTDDDADIIENESEDLFDDDNYDEEFECNDIEI